MSALSSVTPCLLCTQQVPEGVLSGDPIALAQAARGLIQGLATSLHNNTAVLKSFQPIRRRGTSLVERCARHVEEPCGRCGTKECARCAIAVELRAAEDRLNDERDAELAQLELADEDIERVLDKIVGGLCEQHNTFGPVLLREWYALRSLAPSAPTAASSP